MNTKHKHYEFIVAFAEGKGVEYLPHASLNFRHENMNWNRVASASLFEHEEIMFRIKPEVKHTVGYRRYIQFNAYTQAFYTKVYHGDSKEPSPDLTRNFYRWIDTEWQYEVIPEGVEEK